MNQPVSVPEEQPWYSALRERWRPNYVRLLLIGESTPSDGGDTSKRRFFYASELTAYDALFRSVVHAMYDVPHLDSQSSSKDPWLARLRDDGVYLIDLVPYPINGPDAKRRRAPARRENATNCVERATRLEPDGIIVCHGEVFAVLRAPLRNAGLPVLHDVPIPFPIGNWRADFVRKFRAAYARLP